MNKEKLLKFKTAMANIVIKSWNDEAFKQRFLKSPQAVFKEYGFNLKPGVKIHIHEDTKSDDHLNFPHKPSSNEISEATLKKIAQGKGSTNEMDLAYDLIMARPIRYFE